MPKIQFKTHDGQDFDVDGEILRCSTTIVGMDVLDLNGGKTEEENGQRIVLQVDAKIFGLVIEWALHHHENEGPDVAGAAQEDPNDEISEWDAAFLGKLDSDTLFQLMQGANFLDIKELSKIIYKTVANNLKGKTPDEIRAYANLPVVQPIPDDAERAIMKGPHVKLQSSDGMNRAVTLNTTKSIPVVKSEMQNNGNEADRSNGQVIKLTTVNYNTLTDVLDWVQHHTQEDGSESVDDNWDEEFLEYMDQSTLLQLLLAAKDLELEELLTLISRKVAKILNDNTPDDIRKIMGIKDDLTAEEKAMIQKQNDWVMPPPPPPNAAE